MGWNDAQGNLRALSALCVKKNPAVESHAEAAVHAEGHGMLKRFLGALSALGVKKNPAVESHAEAAEPAEGEGMLKRFLGALCALGVKKIRQYSLTRRPQSPQRGEGWCVEKIPPRLLRSRREKNPAVESHAETAEPAEGRGMVC